MQDSFEYFVMEAEVIVNVFFYHTEISWLSFMKYFKRFSNLEPGYSVFYR